MSATVTTSGPIFSPTFVDGLVDHIGEKLLAGSLPMVATARMYAPVKTGNLRDHIEARLSRKKDRIAVILDCPGVPYAWKQEYFNKRNSMFMARATYEHAPRLREVAVDAVYEYVTAGQPTVAAA